MNAIISLCHFCENHGPSILFCTQAFHAQSANGETSAHYLMDATKLKGDVTLPNSSSGEHQEKGQVEKDETSESEEVKADQIPVDIDSSSSTLKAEIKCEACRSLPPSLPGFISNDPEACMSYKSGQHPNHPQVFSMVRQACLRSLSSEVSPGNDGPGPIFFGDDNSGYVLSHVFIIKDSQYSRGFQRRYSIIVVMMDKIFLLNSWPFLVKHMRSIIEELQDKALKVYESEQAKNPTRSQRAHMAGGMYSSVNRGAIAPGKPARSLVDLTGDNHIFRKLHQTFTWLLKAGGNRLTEKLLEGPPTEDSIIDVEKHIETEEGFVLVESKRETAEDTAIEGSLTDGRELLVEDDQSPAFVHIRHLLKVFGYSKFHKLAHHVIIGNQIIIRGRKRKLMKSVIDCLKVLLPKGCCKVLYFGSDYEESWKYNFLGISLDTDIPDTSEPYVVLDIHDSASAQSHNSEVQRAHNPMTLIDLADTDMSTYVFIVYSPTNLPDKVPTVLNKMEFALLNENLADSVVDQYLVCLKEEWMNKVKVLFKFTRAGGSRSEEDTQGLLRVVGAEEDRELLKFWKKGLSAQYKSHMLKSTVNQTPT